MKKGCLVGLLFLFCPFLVGMSGLGDSGRIGVPEPPRNYEATIIDQSDVSTRVDKLSFEGQTAILGRLGSGYISIGFDKIASIQFILEDKTLKSEVWVQYRVTLHQSGCKMSWSLSMIKSHPLQISSLGQMRVVSICVM